ncbi:fimbria/pilus outer membrane usher protein [Escherichia coli]|uniref:fimbria/pilus outer membrane usher protein n=1 Tax=Escherichia coli TaxID=562 RepID=UPI000BE4454F|nr:fimbria/pilus outer membrane usher protein [Escherichia coli]
MRNSNKKKPKLKYIGTYTACVFLIYSGLAQAKKKYEFDPSLINSSDGKVSIDIFNEEPFPAGTYIVDIFLNGDYRITQPVEFVKTEYSNNEISPCLDEKLLLNLGVKKDLAKNAGKCATKNKQWTITHNLYEQSLSVNIAESDLDKIIDGVAPKILWDDGIPSIFLNYRANTSTINSKKNNDSQNYAHLDLTPGLNFGPWRVRNTTFFNYTSTGESKWQNVNNYLERGLKEIDSQLIIGDFLTKNNLFYSSSLRGVALSTDESMIPGRLRNNSPVIRGVAKSQAHVEVEYNGYIIYAKTVDAGIFEFDDLPDVGSEGTYKVTVYESDGTKNIIMIPFIQAPLSLKKGFSTYSINLGRYRGNSFKEIGPTIFDASYSYGINEYVTLSTSLQFSDIYEAYAAGLSFSLGSFGALSLEGTNASAKEYGDKKEVKNGSSVTLKYSKDFQDIGTDLYLANHSYNSKNYRTLNDVYEVLDSETVSDSNRKNSTSIGINKLVNDYGGLRLSYNVDRYWDGNKNKYFDISFNGVFKGITYSLGYNENSDKYRKNNHVFSASINVPFRMDNDQFISTNYRYNNGTSQGETHSVGVSGTSLNNSLSWYVNQRYNNERYYGFSGNSTLRHQYGYIGIGASTDRNSNAYNADVGGGILYTKHGLTFGQEITQSSAVLVAEGASDVPVLGASGVKTNSQGRALVTGLQPYRENILSLDPLETPEDVEILQTDIKVIPTKGAIVEGKFRTSEGQKSLVRITTSNNSNIPFGSIVTLKGDNNNAGIVGDNGEVFLTGLPKSGVLEVKWGHDRDDTCSVSFSELTDYNTKALICH